MKKNSNISERISYLIDYLGISKNKFAQNLGYDRSQALYHIINGKSKPSFDFFEKLCYSQYSETFNLRWIVTGQGEMLTKTENLLQKVEETGTNYEKKSSELKMCQDYVEMQKEYITNLKRQLADCEKKIKSPEKAG